MCKFRILLLIISLLFSGELLAKDFIANGPLEARTQNPIYLQNLALIPSRAVVNKKGIYSMWLHMDYASIFEHGLNGSNEIFFDMELARISVNIKYGFGRDMEVGLQVPFLHFNGGYFDAWIQDFHNFFGFPNGGRERYPNGEFKYYVRKDGKEIYRRNKMGIGLSDVILYYRYNFLKETSSIPGFAFRFGLKFPTGKESTGLGTGKLDYSLGFAMEKSIQRWHFYVNADYIITGWNKELEDLYRGAMLSWLTAVEFNVSSPVSIIAQLQGSTPMLTGLGISEWDGAPLDLVIGVKGMHKKLFWNNDFYWQWSFSEDLYPYGPSVDITTSLTLGVRFGNVK